MVAVSWEPMSYTRYINGSARSARTSWKTLALLLIAADILPAFVDRNPNSPALVEMGA